MSTLGRTCWKIWTLPSRWRGRKKTEHHASFQAGQHPSLVCLVGICEEAASTLVVMEHGEPSLKQWLLGSRALDHQPQYAARHGRVATARWATSFGQRQLLKASANISCLADTTRIDLKALIDWYFKGGTVAWACSRSCLWLAPSASTGHFPWHRLCSECLHGGRDR